MRLGYLYSRYPVLSQTFCDAEMLALEQLGFELEIGSVPPAHEPPARAYRLFARAHSVRTAAGNLKDFRKERENRWQMAVRPGRPARAKIWSRRQGRAARAQRPLLCRPF